MKQVLMKRGVVYVEEVPEPIEEAGFQMVQVSHSCISTGTELSGIKQTGIPLWKRALAEPGKVKKVLSMFETKGLSKTKSILQDKFYSKSPSGYSASGYIAGTDRRVACAGARYAHHAEIIQVPNQLIVPIPTQLGLPEASTVALGAIALQGIRRANPTLGETFAVIGLGFLGQVTVQMLIANGCRAVGIDPDPHRLELSRKFGVETHQPSHVDGVIITAATQSSEVISQAFKMCRKKGRIVLVGDVGLNLKRSDFYEKELDFFISTSYGPGRYDDRYEEKGLDYPIGYVRWTENRNMEEYLRLLAEKKVEISPFIHSIVPLDEAPSAYLILNETLPKPLLALLSYPQKSVPKKVIPNPKSPILQKNQIQIALVGAGGFAKEMHLPHIESDPLFYLKAVVSRSGWNAKAAAVQFRAAYSTTDYKEVIKDPQVDAILISTRHHLHASFTLEALRAGKHVLVEKPLAMNQEELKQIVQFYAEVPDAPILLTGFNRRFSNAAQEIYHQIQHRKHPMVINYRMNAGFIPSDHWVHGEEGGGRNIGEACHIYDLFTFFTQTKVKRVETQSIPCETNDNFIATMSFEDGSIATLTYTSLGCKEYPKEQMELFVEGKVFTINDYKIKNRFEKGQKEELAAFGKAILGKAPWPIPLWQQVQAMEIAFLVESLIRNHRCAD